LKLRPASPILPVLPSRFTISIAVVLVAAGLLSATAGASAEQSPPPGSPDLAAMALTLTDLPAGARIEKQGYVRDSDFVASYDREFVLRGGRLGRSTLVFVGQGLRVERTAEAARQTFTLLARLLSGKRGVRFIKASLVEEGFDPKRIAVGKVRRPKIGQEAIVIPIRLTAQGITLDTAIVYLRFDRVLSLIVPVGLKLHTPVVNRLMRVAADRIRAGLVPANTIPPTIAGTVQVGQTLTAGRGTWAGDQLQFAYRWERCDAAGSGCVAAPGATNSNYLVTTGDLASTLRVSVVGRNRLGVVTGRSGTTAVVTGPAGSPTVTTPPVISGTVAVGGTLTVTVGTWTGSPTTLAYQWRRCDAAGTSCVDIAGATSSTYIVSSSEARSTLRVLVVASNAAGPGGGVSAQTSVVP
jgi:hypothetical protein